MAAGTSINKGLVHWGYIADCGVAIFDEKGNMRFKTEDDGPSKHDALMWKDPRLQSLKWENPIARMIIRRDYRNNSGKQCAYGVLTGEDSSLYFVRTGVQELRPRESLIVYTDGLEHLLGMGEFSDLLRKRDLKGISKLTSKTVKYEGTMIYQSQSE